MRAIVALVAGALALVSCGPIMPETENGVPQLVSTAPDGTKLWRAYDPARADTVYFASTGTERSYTSGKVHRVVRVPSARVDKVTLCEDKGGCYSAKPGPDGSASVSITVRER